MQPKKQCSHTEGVAYCFCAASRAAPTPQRSGVQARIYFYAISFQSVNSKACGSKAASLIFYFFESQPHKNATQRYCGMPPHRAAKRLRHKNTKPTAQKPSFLFRFLLAFAHAANAWSLSIFCCILFFITIKI